MVLGVGVWVDSAENTISKEREDWSGTSEESNMDVLRVWTIGMRCVRWHGIG